MTGQFFRSGIRISEDVSGVQVGSDQSANWAGGSAANTNVTIIYPRGSSPYKERETNPLQ